MITLKQTNKAALAVQKELFNIGLWYENTRLYQTQIFWTRIPFSTLPTACGVFTHSVSRSHLSLGFEEGHIYIPQLQLSENSLQKNTGSLLDIIRHEYGHALAHYYPELIVNSKKFEKVFGGKYYDYRPSEMKPSAYVSDYAKTLPCEDFAETFMVYVRRKGIPPARMADRKLIQKWNFIHQLCKKICRGE